MLIEFPRSSVVLSNGSAHPRRAESRHTRSAGTRGTRERVPCVGCSRMLYRSSNAASAPTCCATKTRAFDSPPAARATRRPSQLGVGDDAVDGHAQSFVEGDRSAPSWAPTLLKRRTSFVGATETTGAARRVLLRVSSLRRDGPVARNSTDQTKRENESRAVGITCGLSRAPL